KLAAEKAATGMFDAALDQFGPHSRIIGPTGVESSYNFDRGGDIDEVRIYDRALSDGDIAQLAKGETPQNIPELKRSVASATIAANATGAVADSSTPTATSASAASLTVESWQQEW